ncbi:hypothetical protein ABZ897_61785 [Nonomuraea sp. NPDC046802]|uniref:hypothetical protein n=1 Tax=Nonomuraea sp. NPDC046802 TaxID=3154919 RepID=UPI0033DDCD28
METLTRNDELAAKLTTVTWEELERRVRAGTRGLNWDEPEWIGITDLERINITCHYRCLLGQTYGSFGQGLDRFEEVL